MTTQRSKMGQTFVSIVIICSDGWSGVSLGMAPKNFTSASSLRSDRLTRTMIAHTPRRSKTLRRSPIINIARTSKSEKRKLTPTLAGLHNANASEWSFLRRFNFNLSHKLAKGHFICHSFYLSFSANFEKLKSAF